MLPKSSPDRPRRVFRIGQGADGEGERRLSLAVGWLERALQERRARGFGASPFRSPYSAPDAERERKDRQWLGRCWRSLGEAWGRRISDVEEQLQASTENNWEEKVGKGAGKVGQRGMGIVSLKICISM